MSEKGPEGNDLAFPDLNDRQVRFVWGIVEGKPASRAYRDAGYTAKGDSAKAAAARLLTNGNVRAALTRAREDLAERTQVNADTVMEELRRVYERTMQITPVLNKQGEVIGEFQFQGMAACRALELMGKALGMFKNKVEVSGGPEPIKVFTVVKTIRADD